ncbi:MAG: TonB-dependent receptor [Bacteroidales bacterium]
MNSIFKTRFIYLVFTFLFFVPKIYSQNKTISQTIRGNIVDAGTRSPVIGASVNLQGQNLSKTTISNENGEFEFNEIPVGSYSIVISSMGYKPVTLTNQQLKSGKEMVLVVELEEMVYVTDEIVVKAHGRKDNPINEMANISARSFTVEETERYAGSLFDPARMASNYAGVLTANDQRNDIIIRGNSPLGLLWRLEGVDIPNPNHFGTMGTTGGPISILNNNLLSNSDFFTSAFPAEYGNALSGVFDLNLRYGNNKKHEFVAQVGLNGFELGAEGPFSKNSKSSYLMSYRYSTLAIFDALGINFGVSGIPQYQDLSFHINIPGTKAGKFSFFGIAGNSYIELLDKNRKENDWTFGRQNIDMFLGSDMGVAGVSHLFFFDQNTRIQTVVAVSGCRVTAKADSAYQNAPSLNYYGEKSIEYRYTISTKFVKRIDAKNTFHIGLMSELYQIDYHDSILTEDYNFKTITKAQGENSVLLQSYIQYQHKFTNDLLIYGGLHYQFYTLNSSQSFEPRVSLKWNLNPRHSFNLGFGFHSQIQPRLFYFLQTTYPDGSFDNTNLNLGFSKSNQYVLGYDFLVNPVFRIKAETYYQHLYQVPVEKRPSYYSLINYGSDYYPERADSLVNNGTGENYGLELTLEKFLGNNYYFLATGSLFNSFYTGSDEIKRNTTFNGNYVINLLAGYTFKIGKVNSLNFDFKIVNAGGRRYIPVDLEKSQFAGKKVLDYENAYNPQYPNYFRIDTRFSFKMNLKKFNAEFAIDIQNITNHQNILLETYDSETGTIKYDYQLGIFYFFLLRFQF